MQIAKTDTNVSVLYSKLISRCLDIYTLTTHMCCAKINLGTNERG